MGLYHDDQEYYLAVIKEVLENDNYIIAFEEYGTEQEVSLGQIKWIKRTRGRWRSRSRSRSRLRSQDNEWKSSTRGERSPIKRFHTDRSPSRSRSRSRGSSNELDSVEINYENLERMVEKRIKKEDTEKQSVHNPKLCAKKFVSEREHIAKTLFNDYSLAIDCSPLVVNLAINKQVVRVQRRGKKKAKNSREIMLEQEREKERNWKPSKNYSKKMEKLKERYG